MLDPKITRQDKMWSVSWHIQCAPQETYIVGIYAILQKTQLKVFLGGLFQMALLVSQILSASLFSGSKLTTITVTVLFWGRVRYKHRRHGLRNIDFEQQYIAYKQKHINSSVLCWLSLFSALSEASVPHACHLPGAWRTTARLARC